jgi:hypothetical protein
LLRAALQLRGIAAFDLFDGHANFVATAAFKEPDRRQGGVAVIELDAEPATVQFLGGLTGRVRAGEDVDEVLTRGLTPPRSPWSGT